MTQPLNKELYQALQAHFGQVRICGDGQAFVGGYCKVTETVGKIAPNEAKNEARYELVVDNPGEYYLVCCPKCHDTRFRLYINHTWGRRDSRGRKNLWLAICFNENCYADPAAREELYEQVSRIGVESLARARISDGERITTPRELTLPGPVYPLDRLAPDHPANQYLAGRFYDPERLGRFYGVGYCPASPYYLATHRIIVPVYQNGSLRGWQARYIGDLDWKAEGAPPKWWTCPGMARARLLYNFDNAIKFRSGVAVEGAGDVWSLGPMAFGCFGCTMTSQQQHLFTQAFGNTGHGSVLLFDPDVMDTPVKAEGYQMLHKKLAPAFSKGLATVLLPKGTDPGSLERGFLRSYITREANAQGVKISWKLR
jgi:hypothetical protein